MSDLADLPTDTKIHILCADLPGFLLYDIEVEDVFNIMMGNPEDYAVKLDPDWMTMVYRVYHHEIYDWLEIPYHKLVDRDYVQQAVNCIMAATLCWCRSFCDAYAKGPNRDTIREKVGECEVIYLNANKDGYH